MSDRETQLLDLLARVEQFLTYAFDFFPQIANSHIAPRLSNDVQLALCAANRPHGLCTKHEKPMRETKIYCQCGNEFVIERAMVDGAGQPTMQCPMCHRRYRLLKYNPGAGVVEFAEADAPT